MLYCTLILIHIIQYPKIKNDLVLSKRLYYFKLI